jgi:hypothetical protein
MTQQPMPGGRTGEVGGGGPGGGGGPDPCDLRYDTDLTGVRAPVLAVVRERDVLDVTLHREGPFETAVCRTRMAADIVGSLAGMEGLDQLLGCLRAGHRYEAKVIEVDRTRCRVLVERVTR